MCVCLAEKLCKFSFCTSAAACAVSAPSAASLKGFHFVDDATVQKMKQGLTTLFSPASQYRVRVPDVNVRPQLDAIHGSLKRTLSSVSEKSRQYVAECFKGVEAFAATFDSGMHDLPEEEPVGGKRQAVGLTSPVVGCSAGCMPRLSPQV